MTEQQTVPAVPSAAPAPIAKPRRRILPLLILVALGAGGYYIWRTYFAVAPVPSNLVVLSGRIEGDDSAVAPKTAGRILEIRVREGDLVKAGDIIAVLDDAQLRARQDQATAAVTGAEARAKAARDQIAVFEQQMQQNQLQTEQARVEASGRVHQAESDLAAVEAEVAQQEAAYKMAAFDKDAYEKLYKTGAASQRQSTQASATADQQAAALAAVRRRLEAARGALTTARSGLSNAGVREMQTSTIRKQIAQQQAEIASGAAGTDQARYQLAEAQANRSDLVIKAPFDGTVMTRSAEPGEVVAAGTAIVTLLDMTKVYMRGFVPEGQIGKVKVGQPARVYLDSNPARPIEAYVQRVDPQATFTPENTYFRDDRVRQVVGVKLQLKSAAGFAKPGMPADGEILVEGTQFPAGRFNK